MERKQEGRYGGCRVRISWQELPRQLRARDLEQFETNSSPGGVRRDDPSNGVTMGSQSNMTKQLN